MPRHDYHNDVQPIDAHVTLPRDASDTDDTEFIPGPIYYVRVVSGGSHNYRIYWDNPPGSYDVDESINRPGYQLLTGRAFHRKATRGAYIRYLGVNDKAFAEPLSLEIARVPHYAGFVAANEPSKDVPYRRHFATAGTVVAGAGSLALCSEAQSDFAQENTENVLHTFQRTLSGVLRLSGAGLAVPSARLSLRVRPYSVFGTVTEVATKDSSGTAALQSIVLDWGWILVNDLQAQGIVAAPLLSTSAPVIPIAGLWSLVLTNLNAGTAFTLQGSVCSLPWRPSYS